MDQENTASAEQADLFVQIDASRQFEVLWVLRALVRGVALDGIRVRKAAGLDLQQLSELGNRLMAARYGAFFHGPLITQGRLTEASATLEAAYGLVAPLNCRSRFVILGMGEPGNAQGAEAVLTWQTGFPASVDLSPGYPTSLPSVTTASRRLGCGEADLALIVGSMPREQLDEESRKWIENIPALVIAPPDETVPAPAKSIVRCFAATPGMEESGTVMRVDGASLPLRPVRSSRLFDRATVARIYRTAYDNSWERVIRMATLRIAEEGAGR